jgi:hypothetical protein
MHKDSEWFDPSSIIKNSNKISDIFGYWPTFHDAWIYSFCLSVAGGKPWLPDSDSPVLDMKVHVFEMTKEVNKEGYFVLDKHTLAHLRFQNVEGLAMSHFSHQNSIFELIFAIEPMTYQFGGGPAEGPPPNVITVKIDSSCGLQGEFKCFSAEVVSTVPCDEDGNILAGCD